jgi:Rps23 Pro-64 3,4-dihydroxylase Tpa1-like proline 4-hydroxylase
MLVSQTGTINAGLTAHARGILPPYLLLRDFLDEASVTGLFDYALAREAAFTPTGVGRSQVDASKPDRRFSLRVRDLGPFGPILGTRVLGFVPDLTARLGGTPVKAPDLELELVARPDGAFYKRHIDTELTSTRSHIRVLSAVYYFYRQPKAFSGGTLSLYAIPRIPNPKFHDIAPEHNSVVVFPAWAPHEVLPVSCPSRRSADSRFAVNCWVRAERSVPGS